MWVLFFVAGGENEDGDYLQLDVGLDSPADFQARLLAEVLIEQNEIGRRLQTLLERLLRGHGMANRIACVLQQARQRDGLRTAVFDQEDFAHYISPRLQARSASKGPARASLACAAG